MKAPNCAQVRSALLRPGCEDRVPSRALEEHLEGCCGCADFSKRARLAVEVLGERESAVIADSGFAARVVQALPEGTENLFGWAALRVLPATLALSLVLGAWCWSATGAPATLVEESPTDDLIGWVLEDGSDGS